MGAQIPYVTQDARGRLFFASSGLLVFDGATWRNFAVPDSYSLNSLCFAPDGRLWAGAVNQLGYYTEIPDGEFIFTSLLGKLPAEDRQFAGIWDCGLVDDQVFFICQSKVLRWDGSAFTVWNFPTKTRLYPVRLGRELWFTHVESGLYRIDFGGPRRVYETNALPSSAPFFLERKDDGILLISRDGMFPAGHPKEVLCSKEVADFLRDKPMSSVVALPDGNVALGTLGGLAIMSPDGRLLRSLRQEDGLPANSINSLFLDRERQLWMTFSFGGLARLDVSGTTSVFRQWRQLDHASIDRLAFKDGTVFAATDSGAYRLDPGTGGTARFVPMPEMPDSCNVVAPWKSGLLVGGFARLDYYDGSKLSPLLHLAGTNFFHCAPSNLDAEVIYAAEGQKIARLRHQPDGSWQNEVLSTLPDYTGQFYVDPQDVLWISNTGHAIWRLDPKSRTLTTIKVNPAAENSEDLVTIGGRGQRVYAFAAQKAHFGDARVGKFQPVAGFPTIAVSGCVVSPDGRALYVSFERHLTASATDYGIGRLALDPDGIPGVWTEFRVPKLDAIGVPYSLLVTEEDGADALWIGGTEGLVRVKPAELAAVRTPSRPWLTVHDASGLSAEPGPAPGYAFGRHHLVAQAGTIDVDDRKDLLFQTRLGSGTGEWSDPSPRATFEFTNLVDGNYSFEVRAINHAGLASPPATFAFRILPPWYRTPWSFAGYAAGGALAVFGYIRLRERRIRARNQELEVLVRQRTDELVKANAAKDEFLAGISHEIRNPMNGVVGLASTLDTSTLGETDRRRVENLRHCASHLSGLLEDILDFSQLQAGAVTITPEPFDLDELMKSLVGITETPSKEAGIPVEVAISPSVPRRLVGDSARIRQILINYVINALKYAGRGQICVTVWGQQTKPDEVDLTFAVSDDGPGISVEEQKRLFTRFERGAAAHYQRVSGTGLGLAMCKTLADKMGGRLAVESQPGEGATFLLKLALPLAAEALPTGGRLTVLGRDGTAAGALRALVVDDEEYNRQALAAYLEQAGFTVTEAADGRAALAAARLKNFDAVFLDVNLPGKNGLDVARELRAIPGVPAGLPIVATTAFTTTDKRAQCFAAGMDAFLTKPVTLDKIRAALTAATGTRRATAPFHPPGETDGADPLAALRLLASRKGVTLEHELKVFLAELESEARLLDESLRIHDSVAAAEAAHRLVGRLAFVRARSAEDIAREVEIAAVNQIWDRTVEAGRQLAAELPNLRDRLTSAA